ncbi:hypothetical protein L2E82_22690 [Cichorium intybus]|uniref:Uncharacterized protein n=1 Tax=Cichorium intybus TaxID=13427 RepID=A0ACB9DYW9_CICIN|nr:hypothetical protein L2E82_22690 [Cichorium intybus]
MTTINEDELVEPIFIPLVKRLIGFTNIPENIIVGVEVGVIVIYRGRFEDVDFIDAKNDFSGGRVDEAAVITAEDCKHELLAQAAGW